MKYIVILGDGMADLPVKELGNKTPLDCAKHPNIPVLHRLFIVQQIGCQIVGVIYYPVWIHVTEVILQIFLQWDMIQKYITQDVLR